MVSSQRSQTPSPPVVAVIPGKGGNGMGRPEKDGDKVERRPAIPPRNRGLSRVITPEGNTVGQLGQLLLFALVMFLALGAAVAPWHAFTRVDLPVDRPADRTFKAPRSLTYNSDVRTQAARDAAALDKDNRVFTRDTALITRQQTAFDLAVRQVNDNRALQSPIDDRIKAVKSAVTGLSDDDARQLLILDGSRWNGVSQAAGRLFVETMGRNIEQDQLTQIKNDLRERVDPSLGASERELAIRLASGFIVPNLREDPDLTRQKIENARAAIAPVQVRIQEGQTIVRDGDIVTRDIREQLQQLDLLRPEIRWAALGGTLGIIAFVVSLLTAYLFRFARPVWRGAQLILLGLILALPIIVARPVLGSHPTWVYAFPVAATAMLTVVLLNFQLATVVAIVGAITLGLLGGSAGSLEYTTLAFAAAVVGAFILWRADRILTFLWAGLAVGATVFTIGVCFRLIAGTLDVTGLAQIAIMAAFNGGVTAVLTFGSFSFLGGLFGITTHLQLLELAHPNQPLLSKLMHEAPGTYHHSIVVSNLAEQAVEIVGGDPLFTRVAVYYHDIGKTLRPTFFIENQANRDNVHDVLDPQQSAHIIIDHVTDGVRLAQKARLPGPIIDIIRQHHGTMLIRYFHNKALEQGDDVREEEFRYPGPKPQTKEAGVIMLADSVEAAVRAAAQSGKLDFAEEPRRPAAPGAGRGTGPLRGGGSRLQDLVTQVIDDRVKSGQLDDCDLTLRDIDRIKQTFVQVLDGIYHPRIDYPTAPAPQIVQPAAV